MTARFSIPDVAAPCPSPIAACRSRRVAVTGASRSIEVLPGAGDLPAHFSK
ncbi:MAG: hypothetical protein IPK81_21470 [Rhodospirillales bacterium]|nr:MAG: hypothetical protein IPK81_21470 [Rhodospirillales bacterium]